MDLNKAYKNLYIPKNKELLTNIQNMIKNPIPQDMIDRIINYIENDKDDCVLVINSFPGSGKTYIMAMITSILNTFMLPWVYFSLNHRIIDDFIGFQNNVFNNLKTTHMKGKSYVESEFKREHGCRSCINCTNQDLCKEKRVCKDPKGFALILKYKRNDYYCNADNCPYYEFCDYPELKKHILSSSSPQPWAGHFLHYPTLYESYKKRYKKFEFLKILDEDINQSFFIQTKFSLYMIEEAYLYIEDKDVLSFLDIVKQSILIPIDREKKNKEDIEKKFEIELYELLISLDMKELKKVRDTYNESIILNYGTLNQLKYENPLEFIIELKIFIDGFNDIVPRFFSKGTYSAHFDYYRRLKESNNMIILNATFESELFSKILPSGTNIKTETISGYFNNDQKIYALYGKKGNPRYATYPLHSLYRKPTLEILSKLKEIGIEVNGMNKKVFTPKFYELIEKSKFFVNKHDKTVIFAVKTLIKKMKELFEDEIKKGIVSIDSFSGGVGNNDYKDYDGLIIFHTPYENVDYAKKMEELWTASEELVFKNGTINKIIQTIFRIRGISYDPKISKKCEILMFTSLEFTDLKFEKDHDIKRFRLHEFYNIFDDNFITPLSKTVYEFINENPGCRSLDIQKGVRGGNKAIQNIIKILVDKNYISFRTSVGRGRPSLTYFALPEDMREDVKKKEDIDLS